MGVEGQIVLGGMVAAYIGYSWELPKVIHLPRGILGAALAGGAVGRYSGIPEGKTSNP